jgi:hypothetical protein
LLSQPSLKAQPAYLAQVLQHDRVVSVLVIPKARQAGAGIVVALEAEANSPFLGTCLDATVCAVDGVNLGLAAPAAQLSRFRSPSLGKSLDSAAPVRLQNVTGAAIQTTERIVSKLHRRLFLTFPGFRSCHWLSSLPWIVAQHTANGKGHSHGTITSSTRRSHLPEAGSLGTPVMGSLQPTDGRVGDLDLCGVARFLHSVLVTSQQGVFRTTTVL